MNRRQLTLPVCISDARGASRPGAPSDGHGGVGQELPQNTSSSQRPITAEDTQEDRFEVQCISSTIWSLWSNFIFGEFLRWCGTYFLILEILVLCSNIWEKKTQT